MRRICRAWISALLIAGLSSLAVAGTPASRPAPFRPACASLVPVAPGVFVVYGQGGQPDRRNDGRVGNTVVLVGSSGVVVVDPGPSRRQGLAVICAIGKLTALPVVALVNTHPHPEQVLANSAFAPGLRIYAATAAAAAMAERCPRCLARLEAALGKRSLAGTRIVIPDTPIGASLEVAPGGRRLLLLPLGDAHSRGDLAVFDLATQTLIAGDVAGIAELPDLRDGTTGAAIAAIEQLQAVAARLVVPGRGPAFAPSLLGRPLAYLKALQAAAISAAEAGVWPPQLAGEADAARLFSRFDELHPLNLQHAYREAEAEWWARPPAPPRVAADTGEPRHGAVRESIRPAPSER